jgi:hypothetical protein
MKWDFWQLDAKVGLNKLGPFQFATRPGEGFAEIRERLYLPSAINGTYEIRGDDGSVTRFIVAGGKVDEQVIRPPAP